MYTEDSHGRERERERGGEGVLLIVAAADKLHKSLYSGFEFKVTAIKCV